jgi:hypothetical protein
LGDCASSPFSPDWGRGLEEPEGVVGVHHSMEDFGVFIATTLDTVYPTPTNTIRKATMLKNPNDFFCLLVFIEIKIRE